MVTAFFARHLMQSSAPVKTGAATGPGGSGTTAVQSTLQTARQAELPATLGKKFELTGELWTYRDGEFQMSGILLKPEGKGPFPAILISHGLGGSAGSFGLSKAREFVKWGLVCIAPTYTHTGGAMGWRPGVGGKAAGAPKGGGVPKAGGGTNQPANVGASDENLRRARTCVEILSSLPEVDAKRIAAYGHSMGGFVTIGLAAKFPDLLKAAAISGSGVAPRAGFPAPSVEAAEAIRTPFLMLHGDSDPVVRPEQSASLKTVLDRNKVPNDRCVFKGVGHPVDKDKSEEVFALIRQWFATHGVLATSANAP